MCLPPSVVSGMNESYIQGPGNRLSCVVTQGLADISYVSATQAAPDTAEGLLTLKVTCAVR